MEWILYRVSEKYYQSHGNVSFQFVLFLLTILFQWFFMLVSNCSCIQIKKGLK